MTDREQLAARIEAARVDEQRAMLVEALQALNTHAHRCWLSIDQFSRFTAMLDAEAYESAAMMLVPEGYSWRVGRFDDGSGHAAVAENDGFMCVEDPDEWFWECESAATPALALSAAAIRAGGA